MDKKDRIDEVCGFGHKWDRHKNSRNAKCYFCNNRRVLCGFNDLGCLYPELLKEWSPNNTKSAHDYIYGSNDPAEWTCRNGHTWSARIASRSRGDGCKQCRKEGLSKSDAYLSNFITKAREKFGDRYDYSKAVWKPKGGKLEIICKIHGSFFQNPYGHLNSSSGCIRCGYMQVSLEEFIQRSKECHGDKYDYSKVSFLTTTDTVEIICPDHGIFLQEPASHMRNHGCRNCGNESRLITFENFLKRAIAEHGDTYIYKKEKWDGGQKTVIECQIHGDFTQNWFNHVKGNGCHECSVDEMRMDLSTFIERANHVHSGKYSYEKVEFENTRDKVTIICNDHGDFSQAVNNHLGGNRCPGCANSGTSIGEQQLASFIKSLGFEIIQRDHSVLGRREIDILIPSLNLGFEYNGNWWHSDEWMTKRHGISAREYHTQKVTGAASAGVALYFVWESDWLSSRSLIEAAVTSIIQAAQSAQSPDPFSVKLLGKLESPIEVAEEPNEELLAA